MRPRLSRGRPATLLRQPAGGLLLLPRAPPARVRPPRPAPAAYPKPSLAAAPRPGGLAGRPAGPRSPRAPARPPGSPARGEGGGRRRLPRWGARGGRGQVRAAGVGRACRALAPVRAARSARSARSGGGEAREAEPGGAPRGPCVQHFCRRPCQVSGTPSRRPSPHPAASFRTELQLGPGWRGARDPRGSEGPWSL